MMTVECCFNCALIGIKNETWIIQMMGKEADLFLCLLNQQLIGVTRLNQTKNLEK
jgi:hypothetical protein